MISNTMYIYKIIHMKNETQPNDTHFIFYKKHIYKQRGRKSDFAKQLSPQISPT